MNRPYLDIEELPAVLPVFPLAGCLLLPRSELPLNIFEPRYLAMVDAALAGDRLIGMIQPQPSDAVEPNPKLCAVGCVGRITRFAETGDGRYFISLEGVCRFRVGQEMQAGHLFRVFTVDFAEFSLDLRPQAKETGVDRNAVLAALRIYADRNGIKVDWQSVANASDEILINSLSMMSPFGIMEKQALLEANGLDARAQVLVAVSERQLAGGDVRHSPLH